MFQHQPDEIILTIIKFLDPFSFCQFRLVCSKFNSISYDLLELMKTLYYKEKFDEIEKRRYQAYLRERESGYYATRYGPVSVKECDEEGMPFGYYSDDYDDYVEIPSDNEDTMTSEMIEYNRRANRRLF